MFDYSRLLEFFVLGVAGASSIEVMKLFELRAKLTQRKYVALRQSLMFWIATGLFLCVAGFITWAFNENNQNVTVWQVFITGMGADAILKKASEALVSNQGIVAGENSSPSFTDMFT